VGYGRSQVGNPFGWKAVRVDAETGLLYMRNRYYHVGWGRFMTQDPLGVGGDPVTRFNSYNYGSGSPLIELDPLGLQVRVTDGKVESIGPYDGATVKMVWDHRSGQFVEHGRFGMLTADGVIPLGRTAGNFNDGWAMLNMAYDRANPRASGPVDLSGLPLRSFDANANEWSPLQPEDVAWLSENLSQWRQATVGTIEGMAFQSAFLSAGVALQWMQVLRQMPAPSSRPCPPSTATRSAVRAPVDLNKINHIFRPGKNLENLVRASGGSKDAAFRAVEQAAQEALKKGMLRLGPNGVLPGKNAGAVLSVNGVSVQMDGGRVLNGVVLLGSFTGL
jgi:RHS repeat-associated protein